MMSQRMRYARIAVPVALAVGLLSGCATTPKTAPSSRDGVLIHISSGPKRPHRVLMGLQMAKLMAEQQDVLVYFDVNGIHVVLKNAPDLAKNPFDSSRTSIKKLLDREVPIYACPGCLKSFGKTPADLMSGVQVAHREAFFGFTDGRILTIDY